MRHREEFLVYFDAQTVDKIWDCAAILQVFYYDSKNFSQYISAWIGHKVTLTSNCSSKSQKNSHKKFFL